MKKYLAILMAAVLALCAMTAWAESKEPAELYRADFTAENMGGWEANNAKGSVTDEGAFLITGRTADWNAPKRMFALTPGVEYTISVEVYQDKADEATFMISVEHYAGGTPSWENLVTGTVAKGEWTTLEGTFTMDKFDSYALYVETLNNANLDYQIKNFVICGPEGAL